MKVGKNFFQDSDGQWWYVVPTTKARKRAIVRTCPVCREDFPSTDKRTKCCSHTCGAALMHEGRPNTTPEKPKAGPALINSDNPRYSRDENGQWWYRPIGTKQHGRTRALIKTCKRCGVEFLANIFHARDNRYRQAQEFCGRTCALRQGVEDNPGRFKGEKGSNWKGGRMVDPRGYVLVWVDNHPSRVDSETGKPYVFEHRLVMEKMLGRYLEPHETVHHKNGQRGDNRPSNLELWSVPQPPGQRVVDKVAYAREIMAQYGHLSAEELERLTE